MKRKVLVMASTFPRWKDDTIPPFVYELSKRLTDEFDISVLTPAYPNATDFEVMENMKVHRFHYFFKKYEKLAGSGGILPTIKKNKWFYFQVPFFLLGEFIALRKLIKETNPDIIHAHWILPQGMIAYLNYKISRKKTEYVVTTWGADMFVFKKSNISSKFLRWIYGKILNNSLKSTTVNSAFEDEMKSICESKDKVIYIPNGVDTELFNPDKKDTGIKKKFSIDGQFILFVGRLTEKKGVHFLLEAMPEVVKKFPKVKLVIIGTGELESSLGEEIKRLNLKNNVILTGAIQNKLLPSFYATSDIFVAPSITTSQGDREGFPTVFGEAMASSTPIITTNIDGIKEIIEIGKNGYVVDQKSSKELSERIIYLIQHKDKLNAIKKSSRNIAIHKYDWKVVGKQYEEVLR